MLSAATHSNSGKTDGAADDDAAAAEKVTRARARHNILTAMLGAARAVVARGGAAAPSAGHAGDNDNGVPRTVWLDEAKDLLCAARSRFCGKPFFFRSSGSALAQLRPWILIPAECSAIL